MIDCPKCGHNQPSSQECVKCGIIFSKFSDVEEKKEKDAKASEDMSESIYPSGIKGVLLKFIDSSLAK